MGASSVTGVSGVGVSGKLTTNELSQLANGPQILVAGYGTAMEGVGSPPSEESSVVFNTPLPGLAEDYVVIVTPLNGGPVFVSDMDDDDLDDDDVDDHFVGFQVISESECDFMYIVTKVGQRPVL